MSDTKLKHAVKHMTGDHKSGGRSKEDGQQQEWDDSGPNREIATRLRELYRSVEEEAIPERFLDLLEKLDEAERTTVGKGSGQ